MSNTAEQFEPSMAALDAMIKKLETSLGKKHSVSPFDEIRRKYGSQPVVAEQPVEEVKQEAPAKA